MKKFLPLFAAVPISLAAICIAGCTTGSHIVTGQTRPAVAPDAVQTYSVAPTNAVTIGTVNAQFDDAGQYATDAVVKRLKKEAGKIGANGIVLSGANTASGANGFGVTSTGGSFWSFGTPSTSASAQAIFVP